MNDVAPSIPAVEESVGTQLMRALYDEVTNLRTAWVVTPQQQQQEVLDRLQAAVADAVRVAVARIATGGFSYISGQIESLTIKDGAKAVLMLGRGSDALHELADRVGQRAVIVFAEEDEYTGGMHVFRGDPDQPALPLEE